jgi:hypothetical protein
MREKDSGTIIEFNNTTVRVCSLVFSRRFNEQRLARIFSFPAVDSDERMSLLLARHWRAYQIRSQHVTLVLPRHRTPLRQRPYDRILSKAGIVPERVILNARGLTDIQQEGFDVTPGDLREALLSRRQHGTWRWRAAIFLAGIFFWCVLMIVHVKDEEGRLRRTAQLLSEHKATATGLFRQEAEAALRRDLIRGPEWHERLDVVINELPLSITLTQMRLALDGSMDLVGQAQDIDALMAYIDALKKRGRWPGLRWQIDGMSKEGRAVFRLRARSRSREQPKGSLR